MLISIRDRLESYRNNLGKSEITQQYGRIPHGCGPLTDQDDSSRSTESSDPAAERLFSPSEGGGCYQAVTGLGEKCSESRKRTVKQDMRVSQTPVTADSNAVRNRI
ncbi:UNVERIFIED_CONTAM: hypothetical protein FKN15_047435 [Acipenser sinensis]